MALIFRGKTECSICGVVIRNDDNIVATSHFIADSNDSLWRFSDSAMHKSCFLCWEHKQTFIEKYNQTYGTIVWRNATYHRTENDGSISVLNKEN